MAPSSDGSGDMCRSDMDPMVSATALRPASP